MSRLRSRPVRQPCAASGRPGRVLRPDVEGESEEKFHQSLSQFITDQMQYLQCPQESASELRYVLYRSVFNKLISRSSTYKRILLCVKAEYDHVIRAVSQRLEEAPHDLRAPCSHDALRAPCSHDDLRAPCSHDDLRAPCSHDDLRAPCSHDALRAPCSHDDLRAPCSHDALRAPCSHDALRAPCSHDALRAPCSHDALRAPCPHDDLRAPCSHDDLRAPCSHDALRAPFSHDDLRAPCSHDALRAPCSHDDLRAPCSQDDLRAPCSHDDLRALHYRTVKDCQSRARLLRDRIRVLSSETAALQLQLHRRRGLSAGRVWTAGLTEAQSEDPELLEEVVEELRARRAALLEERSRCVEEEVRSRLEQEQEVREKRRDQAKEENQQLKLLYKCLQCVCKSVRLWKEEAQCCPLEDLLLSVQEQVTHITVTEEALESEEAQGVEEALESEEAQGVEEDLTQYLLRFVDLFDSAHYREAAQHAAHSPRGALRKLYTVRLFQDVPGPPPSPPPLLLLVQALLVSTPAGQRLPEDVSFEVVRCALEQGHWRLLTNALHFDKLSLSERLGDLLTEHAHRASGNHQAPHQSDQHQSDPHQSDPHQADPHQSDPHQSDPHQADPHQSDPHQSDPHQADPHQSHPHQADLHQSDPHQADPHQSHPHQADPHQSDPHQSDLHQSDPHQADPHQSDPHQSDPHQADPHQSDPHQADPHQSDPHQSDPHQADPHQSDLHQADPHQSDPHQADHHQSDLHQADPHQSDPHQADPHQSDPHQADPHQADPHQADPHQADLLMGLASVCFRACGAHRSLALSLCSRGLLHSSVQLMRRELSAEEVLWVFGRSPSLRLLQLLIVPCEDGSSLLSVGEACVALLSAPHLQDYALQLLQGLLTQGPAALQGAILGAPTSTPQQWIHICALCSSLQPELSQAISTALLSQSGTARLSPDPEGARLTQHLYM